MSGPKWRMWDILLLEPALHFLWRQHNIEYTRAACLLEAHHCCHWREGTVLSPCNSKFKPSNIKTTDAYLKLSTKNDITTPIFYVLKMFHDTVECVVFFLKEWTLLNVC